MHCFSLRLCIEIFPETVALLPLVLRSASQGRFEPLAAQFLMTLGQVGDSVSAGMGCSIVCSEDFPFFDDAAIEASNEGTYLGDTQTDAIQRLWPTGTIPEDFRDPVRSDVPALLLSGEADPVTPPANGDKVARALSQSLHLVAPGQGHNVIFRGCLPQVVASFVEQASIDHLDTICVGDIRPAAFFVSFAGPTP